MDGRRLALVSVSDKRGVVDFARGLVAAGFEVLSTGGTARALREGGVPVTPVSEHTGAPEIFGGRVKTLHPRIHGGILGRRGVDDPEAAGVAWIDLVAVNLYPFEATVADPAVGLDDAMEQVDIGGPCMLRAAAKNHRDVLAVCDPADYPRVLQALREGTADRLRGELAVKAFRHTARYDAVVARWLAGRLGVGPGAEDALPLDRVRALRYGENPHQAATFYAVPGEGGRSLARARQLQGGPLSFNNLADLDGALRCVFAFDGPACAIIKHANPAGAAVHPDGPAAAFRLALSADPVSAFGGIVVFNRPLAGDDARAVRRGRTFFEVLAAPGIDDEAREVLAGRERLRVLELPADWGAARPAGDDLRRVQGGLLVQSWDVGVRPGWRVATRRAPDDDEAELLRFAWEAVKAVRSNAIVLATRDGGGMVLNGVGAGQMSRVDAVRLAVAKAVRPVPGSVMASDAFLPFPDGLEVAREAGVRAVIQPGGSRRDDEVIAAADAGDVAMVFTGVRHFRH